MELNQGVEILLARMDSNPDEFVGLNGASKEKWGWVTRGLAERLSGDARSLPFLNEEEVQALWDKLTVLARDTFTRRVLETLLPEKEELSSSYPKLGGFGAAPIKAEGSAIAYDPRKIRIKTTGRYNLDGDVV